MDRVWGVLATISAAEDSTPDSAAVIGRTLAFVDPQAWAMLSAFSRLPEMFSTPSVTTPGGISSGRAVACCRTLATTSVVSCEPELLLTFARSNDVFSCSHSLPRRFSRSR
eukprot:3764189-Prymnesium_polylepis.1